MPVIVRCRYCNRRFDVVGAEQPLPEHTVSLTEDMRCVGIEMPGHLVSVTSVDAKAATPESG